MLINFVYIKRDTAIHRLDPRVKFALLFAYSFSAAQTSNFWFILAGFIGAIYYYRSARLKWSETRRAWYFIIFITFILVVLNYFISGGAIVQGVDLSLPIPFTTNPSHFGIAFKGMGISDKISYAIDLSLRFLPTTVRDFVTTLDAQRARGFEIDKLRGGLFGKIARLAPMIVPVVIGSIVGAEDIINAMELRCFGVGKRTWLIELHTRQVDRAIITLALAGFAVVTLLNILGFFFTTGPLHILHSQGIPPFLLR